MKKEDLKQDLFRDKLALSVNYIANNKKPLSVIVMIICFIIGGYSFYSINQKEKNVRAMKKLTTEFLKEQIDTTGPKSSV